MANGLLVTGEECDDQNLVEGDWTETFSDVTPWAGQAVTIKVSVEDTSKDWCNMGDHSYRIRADDFYFTQEDS